jgi:hypothetical protein
MTHDPLCDWRPCTCPLDYDVPERGHMIGCPEDDCECDLIAKVRADTLDSVINLLEEMNSQRVWWNDMLTWCISVNEAISQIDNIRWEKEEV